MVLSFKKARREAELAAARRAIEEVARREHKTVEEVRADMTEAMLEGWYSSDPAARALWQTIPCEGEMPTPEELIAWAGKRLRDGRLS